MLISSEKMIESAYLMSRVHYKYILFCFHSCDKQQIVTINEYEHVRQVIRATATEKNVFLKLSRKRKICRPA
jgi:hypothetical protein